MGRIIRIPLKLRRVRILSFNPLDLKSTAAAGRLFTPHVDQTQLCILASWFDLFQRRFLEDTFETHLTLYWVDSLLILHPAMGRQF